jgi:dTDP-4-amino-4,6-dideoxygalactose transaminase
MNAKLAILGGKPIRTAPFPQWPVSGKEEEDALLRVLRSGRWGRCAGGEVERFERRFAEYHGAKYGLAVTSGTVALRVALMAIGIEAGDEVIVPPYTFLATATAVVECNATPIFVDIEPDSYNLDPTLIESAITPRTKAIIPVHLAGLPADMDAILAIAEKHGLTVIEDGAQAHGAVYKGRRVGPLGQLSCFSFQASKNVNSGEGGIVLTSDEHLYELARSFHNCGRLPDGPWYEHHIISGNYRLTEFQAALLSCQFDRLEEQFRQREANAAYLAERLSHVPGIAVQTCRISDVRHAYHLFLFRYDPEVYRCPKRVFLKALRAEGIPASEGYLLPLHRQPLFRNKVFGPYTGYRQTRPDLDYGRVSCPVAERACELDTGWLYQSILLGTRDDMGDIGATLEKVYEHRHELVYVSAESPVELR